MPQHIKLEQRVMQRMEVKVGGQYTLFRHIGRVLDGAEVVDIILTGNDDHTAGMLACRVFDADTAEAKPVDLGRRCRSPLLLQIFFDKAVGLALLNAADGAGLENIFTAEYFLNIAVGALLVLRRKVEIDIRFLVAVEAEKGLKGDILPIAEHRCAAVRAVFIGQIKA